ncbi:MAG: polysaccharide biosynthesis/export family protein [Pelobium sp.]
MKGNDYRLKTSLFFLLSIIFFSSCGSYQKNILFNSKYDVLADTAKTVYVANDKHKPLNEDYILRVGDRIAFKNLQDVKLVTENSKLDLKDGSEVKSGYLIEKDSMVFLPVVGNIKLAGFSRSEARNIINERYAAKLLKDPMIDIYILNFSVTILGEFNTQGKIYLETEPTDIIDVLGLAKGVSLIADVQKLKIIRGNLQNPEIIYVNLSDINSLASNKIYLQNKDILYLPAKKSFYKSETTRTNINLIQPLILVLNTILVLYNITR